MTILAAYDYEKLRELEESLWRIETRFNQEYMNKILASDFFEFGRSGRVYKREDTLGASPEKIDIKFPLKNFKIHSIDTNVVLVTYISEVMYSELQIGNRSSIWSKTSEGWQLRFHQGTPIMR